MKTWKPMVVSVVFGAMLTTGCAAARMPAMRARAATVDTRPFARTSVWNQPLSRRTALDPASARIVANLGAQVDGLAARGYGPAINVSQYSVPVYVVGASQPTERVVLDNGANYAASLRRALAEVPVPSGARAAYGNDQHMVIQQPSTDTMWEFWKMRRESDGWHAKAAGKMAHVSRSPGYFAGPAGFPWGATATSLPLLGGLIRPGELARGRIDHALAMSIPKIRAGRWTFPAQRTDGSSSDKDAVPAGARFRLDPRIDVQALDVPRTVKVLARAAQRYGIIVRDTAATVVFYAQDPATMRTNPYPDLFGGASTQSLMARFPWKDLQVTKLDLRGYRGPR